MQTGPSPTDARSVDAMIPTATVETSVVIDAIEGTDAAAVELFARAIAGAFDLAVSTRLWHELKSQPSPELRSFLEGLPVLGSPARWSLSTWSGGDYWADATDAAAGDDLDGDHVAAHRRSGRSFFLSRDRRQLKRARAAGVEAMTPADFLKMFPLR